MLTTNNGLDGVQFLIFTFSTAGNMQVPRAIRCCSGGHVGNIKVSGILHKEGCFQGAPIQVQTWKKKRTQEHVGVILFPQCPNAVFNLCYLWMYTKYAADGVKLVHCQVVQSNQTKKKAHNSEEQTEIKAGKVPVIFVKVAGTVIVVG